MIPKLYPEPVFYSGSQIGDDEIQSQRVFVDFGDESQKK